jgi:tRNA uridine 5-carbamoylmethylation protein Kti12
MSLRSSGNQLAALTKELFLKWDDTKSYWKDSKSDEFEKKYLEELQANVDTAVVVIEQLDKIITKIRRDCE